MRFNLSLAAIATTALLAACQGKQPAPSSTQDMIVAEPDAMPADGQPPTAPPDTGSGLAAADSAHRFASWTGKWAGVEGMYVIITPTDPETYRIEMQSDLDTKGVYVGHDSEHGIRFMRGGTAFNLHRGSGDETGLKYLAGKQQCLVVKPGEGYCRD